MATHRQNILILNGPNLNMLGVREPDLYGFKNLATIALECEDYAEELGFGIDFRQTNVEGEMVSIIQEAMEGYAGVIINAAAYSHTSVAIADALKLLDIPIIEVHLTNTQKREEFRHHSFVADVAYGTIAGFGGHGYLLALNALRGLLDDNND